MNKTLLACALAAGLVGTAHAQSNVTLYGLVDLGYGYSKTDGSNTLNSIDSSTSAGSRWGLRGSESLGKDLKLNFQLESGFDADTGNRAQGGRMFGRAAWASLSGSFGEVRLGRQDSLGFNWSGAISPFGTSFKQAQLDTIFGYKNVGDRLDNAIFYYSPDFGGFQAGVGYSFHPDGQETDINDTPVISLGARYKSGPLLVVLTYDQKNVADSVTVGNRDDIKNLALGATYDFGVAKVHAGYGRLQNRGFIASASKENAYLLGLTVPVGNGSVFGTYQRVDNRNLNEFRIDEARSGFAIGYLHDLSKRTKLYAYASQYSDVAVRATAATRLADTRQFSVGVRHSF
ncbi:porin [Pigmentiphaga aceris]|uniref:porin n=1 Tax=Pigmentiphaga aceris TaxID=1940612 RepID=UPI001652655C|nr:porin [Pigmentiphaga aceris]